VRNQFPQKNPLRDLRFAGIGFLSRTHFPSPVLACLLYPPTSRKPQHPSDPSPASTAPRFPLLPDVEPIRHPLPDHMLLTHRVRIVLLRLLLRQTDGGIHAELLMVPFSTQSLILTQQKKTRGSLETFFKIIDAALRLVVVASCCAPLSLTPLVFQCMPSLYRVAPFAHVRNSIRNEAGQV